MELSVIIVNWNSVQFLDGCLRSIRRHMKEVQYEIIVVDNASYDGSEKLVTESFPEVKFIQSAKNAGFSAANNLGFQHSSGSAILFLNPDTEFVDDDFPEVLKYLNSNPQVGAVGCRVVNPDMTLQVSYVQAFPTIPNQIFTTDSLVRTFPKSKLWNVRPVTSENAVFNVEVIAGSCILVKRSVFDLVGKFNETFFMYAEDVDLCYMIQQAGYSVQYVPRATVIHYGGQSSATKAESQFSSIMQRQSIALFLRLRKGRLNSLAYRVAVACVACVRVVLLSVLMPFTKAAEKKRIRVAGALKKWSKVLRWSCGFERWAERAGR